MQSNGKCELDIGNADLIIYLGCCQYGISKVNITFHLFFPLENVSMKCVFQRFELDGNANWNVSAIS